VESTVKDAPRVGIGLAAARLKAKMTPAATAKFREQRINFIEYPFAALGR